MNKHPTKVLSFENHRGRIRNIDIDIEIADLIQLLWKVGIRTSSSCQGDEGSSDKIYIQFANHESVLKFVDIITDYEDPNDESQMLLWNALEYENGFTYGITIRDRNRPIRDFPEDFPPDRLSQYQKPYPYHYFNVNMYFDHKYKELIMEKLKKYADNLDETKERIIFTDEDE